MLLALVLGLVSAVSTYTGIGHFRSWAERRQILDLPNERSSHAHPVPRGGGLAMVVVILSGSSLVAAFFPSLWRCYVFYAAGALLVAGISWYDDLRSLPNSIRFATHILAAIIAIAGLGYWHTLELPLFGMIALGGWGTIVTAVWIVGLINAYNFMDGTDGIAGSQALVAGIGWGVIGYQSGNTLLVNLGFLMAGSSFGFLIHNWHPARIFMGDVGSTFLGYTLAMMPIIYNFSINGPGAPILGLLLVWPFIFDAGFTFMRRLCKGKNVFAAHRSHLYQRMSSTRSGHVRVALVYSGMALAGCLMAQAWATRVASEEVILLIVLPILCLALWTLAIIYERRPVRVTDRQWSEIERA